MSVTAKGLGPVKKAGLRSFAAFATKVRFSNQKSDDRIFSPAKTSYVADRAPLSPSRNTYAGAPKRISSTLSEPST